MTGGSTASIPDLLASRYRVLGPVGRGAIAEVVRARDEQTGAEVALKILYPHLRESAAVVERFRREVAIVRRIAEPHVLAIHEVVESDGQLFLVMDYHPGGDLADRLARKRALDADEVRELAAQLCGALAAAHRAGVVHRDVKPSNVLCGPDARLDVRLCDFGLARAADFSGLTTANAVLGTPEYMAPEVVTDGHADPRSDIYSLGVMLFEAATGRLPFYGDSPYQLMRQHVDIEAPRARGLAPDLPAAIDAAIARALAKDPLDRFATVEDLARALADDSPAPSPALVSGDIRDARAPRLPAVRRLAGRGRRSLRRLRHRAAADRRRGRGWRIRSGVRARSESAARSMPGSTSRCTRLLDELPAGPRAGRAGTPSRAAPPVLRRERDHPAVGERTDHAAARRRLRCTHRDALGPRVAPDAEEVLDHDRAAHDRRRCSLHTWGRKSFGPLAICSAMS